MVKNDFGKKYLVFLLLFLGILSAFGPFVTDMYLPVLPQMAQIFECSASTAQLGLTMSLVGLAMGQLFFGPLSDKFGRRPVLLASLALFVVSTVIILLSPTIEWFNICRFFQGIGGAGGIVLSRSIATDYYSGRELTKTLAVIGAINGIAPVVSPVVGGVVASFTGWQGIFIILLCLGITLVGLCYIFRESHPIEKRNPGNVLSSFGSFIKLARKPYFRIYALLNTFSCGVLFAYISSASFIIQDHYGFTPLAFSICFAINSVFIALGSCLSVKIKESVKSALIGSVILVATTAAQLVMSYAGDSFVMYEAITLVMLTGLGFVFTSSTTLTMTEGRSYIGAASALFGAMGFLFGGVISPLVGLGEILHSTMIVSLTCSVVILVLAIAAVKRHE